MKTALLAALSSLFLSVSAHGSVARTIMEGVPAQRNTILVSTTNARVMISTRTYGGKVSNVGLFTSSNVVVSSDGSDKIVLYATGSIVLNGTPINAVYNSTRADLGQIDLSITNTSLGPAISTITMTTSGKDVLLGFSFSVRHGFQYYPVNACVMVDGTFIPPCSATRGVANALSYDATRDFLLASPPVLLTGLAAGSHKFQLTVSVPAGGTATIPLNSAPFFEVYFMAKEVP